MHHPLTPSKCPISLHRRLERVVAVLLDLFEPSSVLDALGDLRAKLGRSFEAVDS